MRLLILGGSGMLGHKLWQVASARAEAYATVRTGLAQSAVAGVLDPARTVEHVTAERPESVARALDLVRPDVVVNCIGIVKQRPDASDPILSITVNALLPHHLAALCQSRAVRLIQVSTDCVFSGQRGNYAETDRPDPEDLYGQTKLLGEVAGPGCLTVRSSMIGRELGTARGLVEWALSQGGQTVRGFRRAIFSGHTTLELARIICEVAERHPDLQGLWHVAAEPISKLELLTLIREAFALDLTIQPDDLPAIDRSLDGRRFSAETGLVAPGWPTMIRDLANDPTPYDEPAARA
jgi:dTDP-4-dehydrorhamnose reductase